MPVRPACGAALTLVRAVGEFAADAASVALMALRKHSERGGECGVGLPGPSTAGHVLSAGQWLASDEPPCHVPSFNGRILSMDDRVADGWGRLVAQVGRALPAIDSLLAATALLGSELGAQPH